MSDGSSQGMTAEGALGVILGGDEPPSPDAMDTEHTPDAWAARLLAKDDNINGYDEHAQVLAKYILLAIQRMPMLARLGSEAQYLVDEDDGRPLYERTHYGTVVVPAIDGPLKDVVYTDPEHPFRRALNAATGFSFGWAVNIVRYALELPPLPNPAIITVGG